MMCKIKGWMDKGHYDEQYYKVDAKGGIMMCNLQRLMDK